MSKTQGTWCKGKECQCCSCIKREWLHSRFTKTPGLENVPRKATWDENVYFPRWILDFWWLSCIGKSTNIYMDDMAYGFYSGTNGYTNKPHQKSTQVPSETTPNSSNQRWWSALVFAITGPSSHHMALEMAAVVGTGKVRCIALEKWWFIFVSLLWGPFVDH